MKDIDRVSPAPRPPRTAINHQRWADLGFLHWPVPVAALRDLIPRALGFGEVLPRYENAVDIDPELKDKWGIRRRWTGKV